MGYLQADVYNQPEKFGLTPIGEVNTGASYEFDIVAVWKHEDGRLLVGTDSGCSCPSPFEDHTSLDSLEELTSLAQMASMLGGALRNGSPDRGDATELLGRVASYL